MLTTEGREAGGNPATHQWYPQAVIIDAPTSINLMRVLQHDFVLKDFEAHDHTTENLIAMDGDLIVGMAAAGDLKEENVTAFYIPAAWASPSSRRYGTLCPWLWARTVMSVCIFKNNTSHDDIYFASLPEDIGLML